ncbi:hypothetical protein V8C35DRAFT_160394 [Trichoderma chlorosporum]
MRWVYQFIFLRAHRFHMYNPRVMENLTGWRLHRSTSRQKPPSSDHFCFLLFIFFFSVPKHSFEAAMEKYTQTRKRGGEARAVLALTVPFQGPRKRRYDTRRTAGQHTRIRTLDTATC